MTVLRQAQQPSSLQEGFGKQIQLIFGKIDVGRNFVFVSRDKTFYIPLYQLDRCRPARLAVIAQRTVLPRRQLKGDRMVLVIATLPFLVLLMSHNTLI